jgi:hypothetical protein
MPIFILAIFEQPPGKVKQNKDFFQESKHKERSIASFDGSLTILLAMRQFTQSI